MSKISQNTGGKRVTIKENESTIFQIGYGFSEIHSRLSEEDRALEMMSEDQI